MSDKPVEIVQAKVPVTPVFAGLSPAACESLDAIGAVWNDDINRHRRIVMDIYSPLAAQAAKAGITVTKNIAYGVHERQILDVFRPRVATLRPVIVFVHGGAFVRGQKDMNDEIYSNVLWYFARHGFVGVNMEYRLAPAAAYPAGAEDVAAAVAWVGKHIGEYGGDPTRIVLIGHSAGGTHAAGYMLDPNIGLTPNLGVHGIVLVSARLRADIRPENPNAQNVSAYFGADPSLFDRRSPVIYAARCRCPVFVAIAEYENRFLDVYGAEFYFRLAEARGHASRFLRLPRHNHTSITAHINTGEDILGKAIRDFISAECNIQL